MPYYARKSSTRKTYKKTSRPTSTYRRKTYTSKAVPYQVKTYVKRVLSKAAEDKFQCLAQPYQSPIFQYPASSTVLEWTCPPLIEPFDNVTQGVGQGSRVGNEITLKKWVIRGNLVQNSDKIVADETIGSNTLYIDVYIGYRKDYEPITPLLTNLYQSGNNAYSPLGQFTDLQHWINKDEYTVLWHRRYKMGNNSNNNDFSFAKQFSVDLCKHGFKNHKVHYTDAGVVQDAKLQALTLWTVAANANGTDITGAAQAYEQESQYVINYQSNIMYQDM